MQTKTIAPPGDIAANAATAPAVPVLELAGTAANVEIVRGRDLTIRFDSLRCIHSRQCVLGAPSVFMANTPGDWIFPDTVSAEQLAAVAHNCPSGAISYERHDGGSAEMTPAVNTIYLRENGPYAIHAPLKVAHHGDGFRATLCRCGQSKNKPWCDGAHVTASFIATGEPPTREMESLAARDGALDVVLLRDGPLHIAGNVEICAGSGRTVARCTDTYLCRCGQSNNKPFCDGSHANAGFTAGGS